MLPWCFPKLFSRVCSNSPRPYRLENLKVKPNNLFFFFSGLIIIFQFKYFYTRVVDLQCWVNYCCTTNWFRYTYISSFLKKILFHYDLSQPSFNKPSWWFWASQTLRTIAINSPTLLLQRSEMTIEWNS